MFEIFGWIVVVEYDLERVYMFNNKGTYKFTFHSNPNYPDEKLLYPVHVTITPDGDIVMTDQTNTGTVKKSTILALKMYKNVTPESTTLRCSSICIWCMLVMLTGKLLQYIETSRLLHCRFLFNQYILLVIDSTGICV